MNEYRKILLDFSEPHTDPVVFGKVITCMYTGSESQQRDARLIYDEFRRKQYAWEKIDKVLLSSENEQVKCCALQILEDMIKTTWPVYETFHSAIHKYIVGVILDRVTNHKSFKTEKAYINKLNAVLVEIWKWEWPHNYPRIISEMISASRSNTRICENNMNILMILGDEIFEHSSDQMPEERAKNLKDEFCRSFHIMFRPCIYVLTDSTIQPLVKTTLNAVSHFLRWMPATCIFDNKLESYLIGKHLSYPQFQMVTLKCLTEIVRFHNKKYEKELVTLFKDTVKKLEKWFPFTDELAKGEFTRQEACQNVSLFLCTFLKEHGSLIDKSERNDALLGALNTLLLIMEEKDVEALKICVEYWNSLVVNLYKEKLSAIPSSKPYLPVLTKLRSTMIECMSKPEEILIMEAISQMSHKYERSNPEVLVVEEELESIRELVANTTSMQLYKDMKETLVCLTHLDYDETEKIMLEKLHNLVNGTKWSVENLDTLCWAIGSVTSAMQEEQELLFLVAVLKDLLELFEQKQRKDDKQKIALNTVYIVGEYPRFLKAHWILLKSIMTKLFDFMRETQPSIQPGVQNMACHTFLKIAQSCQERFLQIQVGENESFIEYILTDMNNIIHHLQLQQNLTFYEAVGYIIAAETDEEVRDSLIEKYMSLPNEVWNSLVRIANKEGLKHDFAFVQLEYILKTNVVACMTLGHSYVIQLRQIYKDLLNIYKKIIKYERKIGETARKQPKAVLMRRVKKGILKLISEWIKRSADSRMVVDEFIPPLLDSVRLNYQLCPIPLSREPEVISMMTIIVNQLKSDISPAIPKIFKFVLECTFDMIKETSADLPGHHTNFPEHQTNFLLLLHATVTHCFSALLNIDSAEFRLVWDSIIWAFEHNTENVVETGLEVLYHFLQNMEDEVAFSQSFYQKYYTDLLERLFVTVMQVSRSTDLTMQATILAYMFGLVKSGKITVSLSGQQENLAYVQKFVTDLMLSYNTPLPSVEETAESQIASVVQEFFNLHQDILAFKQHLRNFLLSCIREDEQNKA